MSLRCALLTAGLIAAAPGGLARAQLPAGESAAGASQVEAMLACRDIEDDARRADCLDDTVSAFADALERGDITVVERRAVREIERDGFGLGLLSLSGLQGAFNPGRADRSDSPSPGSEPIRETLPDGAVAEYNTAGELDQISNAPVAAVRDTRDGIIVTLESGQVWRQTDAARILPVRPRHLEAGLTAEIRRGTLGSFFMTLSHDGRRMRAERVR